MSISKISVFVFFSVFIYLTVQYAYKEVFITPIDLSFVGTDQAKAEYYNRLVDALSEMDETDQAKDNYKRALEIQLKKVGPEHVHVPSTYNSLGNSLSKLGETDRAKDYYDATCCNNLGNLHRTL